jgi:cysteine-rich repeat protein
MSHAHPRIARPGRIPAVVVLLWSLASAGCDSGTGLSGDQDADDAGDRAEDALDIGADADGDGRAEADADTGRDADAETDAGRDADAEIDAGHDTDAEIDAGRDADADAALDVPAGSCGDGVRNLGEGCDDGNAIDDDGCRNDCSLPTCGDGVVSDIEECDDGPANSDTEPDACRTRCVRPVCGDGVVDTGERCDDGNHVDGDACPASCFPDDEAPVTLEGDPVATDDSFDAGGQPHVVWNGAGWGIAWGGRGMAHFASLDTDARLLAPASMLPFAGGVTALAWREGEYGIAFLAGWPSYEGAAALLDETGVVHAGPSWPPAAGEGIDLAWAPSLDAWVLAYVAYDVGGSAGSVRAVAMDDHAGFLGTPVVVSEESEERGPVVVSTDARVVIAWIDDEGIWNRGLSWPDGGGDPPRRLLDGLARATDWIGVAAYRADLVMGWGRSGAIQLVGVDGWSLDALGDVATIGEGRSRPALAAVPGRGYLGVCWCIGPSDSTESDRVQFRMIRPDGATMGPEITIRDGMRNAGSCAVGWSGTEFVVAYWWAGGDGAWNTVYAQRVRPVI